MKDLVVRSGANPVVRPDQIPGGANCVFNSGAAVVDGEIVMLLSTWVRDWSSRFLVARSRNGVDFTIEDRDMMTPPREYPYYPYGGIFDTRITELEGWYYITHNVASRLGGRIVLSRTRDFTSLEELGYITGPDHRNCVLFPQKIDGKYLRLERPMLEGGDGDIYLSRSPDLRYWGETELLFERGLRYWESAKIGPGAPPVKTDLGWLVIYHGVRQSLNGYSYQAGCLLLDLENPLRILGKLRAPLLDPQAEYERIGNVNNVVFPTAALEFDGRLLIYYGAADTVMAVAEADALELARACLEDGPPEADESYPKRVH